MGLALDELAGTKDHVHENNGISILMDNTIKRFVENGEQLTVDFRETPYGKGFIIDGGSTC